MKKRKQNENSQKGNRNDVEEQVKAQEEENPQTEAKARKQGAQAEVFNKRNQMPLGAPAEAKANEDQPPPERELKKTQRHHLTTKNFGRSKICWASKTCFDV